MVEEFISPAGTRLSYQARGAAHQRRQHEGALAMTRYITIAHQQPSQNLFDRWILTPQAQESAEKLRMTTRRFLQMHVEMADNDEVWLFHRRVHDNAYDLVVAPKRRAYQL